MNFMNLLREKMCEDEKSVIVKNQDLQKTPAGASQFGKNTQHRRGVGGRG